MSPYKKFWSHIYLFLPYRFFKKYLLGTFSLNKCGRYCMEINNATVPNKCDWLSLHTDSCEIIFYCLLKQPTVYTLSSLNNFYKVSDTSVPPNCIFGYKDIVMTVTSNYISSDNRWILESILQLYPFFFRCLSILSKSPFRGNREEAAALLKSFHRLEEH